MWLCRLSPKIWTYFAVICSIFTVSHILADSCVFLPMFFCIASLAVWGIQSMAYFHFHHKYVTKTFKFSLVFHVDCDKLTSKPSEANSGTDANIYQGFISNLGQSKNMWTAPLIRNMNCAITYIYVHKKLSCLWQVYIHGFKTNILEQIIHVSASLWLTKGLTGLHGDSY